MNEKGLIIFSALSCVLSFSVCVLGWRKDLCSWNVLQVVYWIFCSGVAYLEVASISKLRLHDLIVDDSYIKWNVELNAIFFFEIYMVTCALGTEMKIGSDPCRM